jgi:hypothetical protein
LKQHIHKEKDDLSNPLVGDKTVSENPVPHGYYNFPQFANMENVG